VAGRGEGNVSEFRLVKAREAARIMGGVCVNTFYRMNIPFTRLTERGDRMWDVRDLEAAADKQKSRKDYLRKVREARVA